MRKEVSYYYFGPQCYGNKYMGIQAKKAAELLNYAYREYDISKEDIPDDLRLYFPGNIVIGDFVMVYPGSPKQIIEAYKLSGPLPGTHEHTSRPFKSPDYIYPLLPYLQDGACICIKGYNQDVSSKYEWMNCEAKYTANQAGLIGWHDKNPIAAVEWIREDRCPYSIASKRNDYIFITCIYNSPVSDFDYRPALIAEMQKFVISNNYAGISVISGRETPYPNGPSSLFEQLDFKHSEDLGEVLLRHKWEPVILLEWSVK